MEIKATRRPRNIFIKVSEPDMAKLDQRTIKNLKQALLLWTVYNYNLSGTDLGKNSFDHVCQIQTANGDQSSFDARRDTQYASRYIQKALDQMGLNHTAANYLFGDKDQNEANENRALEITLNRAIGMINPFKVSALSDDKLESALSQLNDDYEQQSKGQIQRLVDRNAFSQFDNKPEKPTLIGALRRFSQGQ